MIDDEPQAMNKEIINGSINYVPSSSGNNCNANDGPISQSGALPPAIVGYINSAGSSLVPTQSISHDGADKVVKESTSRELLDDDTLDSHRQSHSSDLQNNILESTSQPQGNSISEQKASGTKSNKTKSNSDLGSQTQGTANPYMRVTRSALGTNGGSTDDITSSTNNGRDDSAKVEFTDLKEPMSNEAVQVSKKAKREVK